MATAWITAGIFLLLAATSLFLALKAATRRLIICARPFIALCVCLSLYLIGGAFEIIHHDINWILFWNNVIYLGLVWLGPLWLYIAIAYIRGEKAPARWLSASLFLIPALTILLKYTNHFHGLCYTSIGINKNEFLWTISFAKGPWYWVHILYSGLTLCIGSLIFIATFFQATGRFRGQALLLAFTGLVPLASLVVYQSGLFLWGLDIIPYSFTFAILMLSIGLLRQDLFTEIPLSWRSILEAVTAGIIVLDRKQNVLEMNGSARAVIGFSLQKKAIVSWSQLVTQTPALASLDLSSETARTSFTIDRDSGQIFVRAHTAPLYDPKGDTIGKTVFLTIDARNRTAAEDPLIDRDAARLVEGMEKKRWFLDPDLGLESLARRVGLPRNRVSYILNRKFKSSAKDFINGYRVREAMRRLSERPNNVLDVCFDVGFNAKATFYATFKKCTGMAPGNFAKKNEGSKDAP
jgi:AraC-like DNA-binding protein